ncbi:cytochrome P450 2C15-like [Micropterus salmoides]|uniref:cytochrome P450 2C15-like n=1 Tax=Micropterus salmoides TaxID=27706 RepID=UPI0018EB1937|nr:cytochrome P450 2C15-like [Micropterus salmoides]
MSQLTCKLTLCALCVTTPVEGVILADYGSFWRDHRRFALMTLRNFGLGKDSMEERIHGELRYTIDTLEKSIGKSFSPRLMFHNAASNIICQVLFGTRYEYDDEFIKVIVQCFTENAKIANEPWAMLYDTLPMIHNLSLPFIKALKNAKTCQNLVKTEHKKTRVPGEPRDFLDCYLDEMEKGTMIIPDLTSVLSEEGQWKFSHEFNPENFLNDKGEFVKPEAFMPFSAGPRMCLGEGLARMELFLVMVTLLRKFKFIWPEDAGVPDYSPVYGVTLTHKPYQMKVQHKAMQ